jgi:hypothetical protein
MAYNPKCVIYPNIPKRKVSVMALPRAGVLVSYEAVQALTDLPINTLHQAATIPPPNRKRMRLDIESLESVVIWLAKHGKRTLRQKILAHSAESLLDEGALPGVPRGKAKKSR